MFMINFVIDAVLGVPAVCFSQIKRKTVSCLAVRSSKIVPHTCYWLIRVTASSPGSEFYQQLHQALRELVYCPTTPPMFEKENSDINNLQRR